MLFLPWIRFVDERTDRWSSMVEPMEAKEQLKECP
jgi:hypothetical protein